MFVLGTRVARWFLFKPKIPKTLEGLALEDNGIFYVHLVNIPAIWHIYGHLVLFTPFWYIFTRFGMLYEEKSGNPVWNCGKVGRAAKWAKSIVILYICTYKFHLVAKISGFGFCDPKQS
jgi:hypothetical protein